jgi:hypothetical protein
MLIVGPNSEMAATMDFHRYSGTYEPVKEIFPKIISISFYKISDKQPALKGIYL